MVATQREPYLARFERGPILAIEEVESPFEHDKNLLLPVMFMGRGPPPGGDVWMPAQHVKLVDRLVARVSIGSPKTWMIGLPLMLVLSPHVLNTPEQC